MIMKKLIPQGIGCSFPDNTAGSSFGQKHFLPEWTLITGFPGVASSIPLFLPLFPCGKGIFYHKSEL